MSTHRANPVGTPVLDSTLADRCRPFESRVPGQDVLWDGERQGPLLAVPRHARPGAQPAIELTIEADSLDTENKKRDTHLRSPDFFV